MRYLCRVTTDYGNTPVDIPFDYIKSAALMCNMLTNKGIQVELLRVITHCEEESISVMDVLNKF